MNEWVDTNTLFVALHSGDEGNEPDGTLEVTAADYDRQPLDLADVSITGSGPTTLTNDNDIVFTASTESNWGDVTWGSLWTAVTGGNPRTSTVELTNGGAAPEGIEVRIDAGQLTFALD